MVEYDGAMLMNICLDCNEENEEIDEVDGWVNLESLFI
jgi:hypothetical protein